MAVGYPFDNVGYPGGAGVAAVPAGSRIDTTVIAPALVNDNLVPTSGVAPVTQSTKGVVVPNDNVPTPPATVKSKH